MTRDQFTINLDMIIEYIKKLKSEFGDMKKEDIINELKRNMEDSNFRRVYGLPPSKKYTYQMLIEDLIDEESWLW